MIEISPMQENFSLEEKKRIFDETYRDSLLEWILCCVGVQDSSWILGAMTCYAESFNDKSQTLADLEKHIYKLSDFEKFCEGYITFKKKYREVFVSTFKKMEEK